MLHKETPFKPKEGKKKGCVGGIVVCIYSSNAQCV